MWSPLLFAVLLLQHPSLGSGKMPEEIEQTLIKEKAQIEEHKKEVEDATKKAGDHEAWKKRVNADR